MNLSRLAIENFAIEESPTINLQSLSGNDLLFYGGNRSGKTLIFNAILYGLYGRRETFGVSPGQRSQVTLHFDNADTIEREGEHIYRHRGEQIDATEGVKSYIGPKDTVRLQFVPSESSDQPLGRLSGPETLDRIRAILSISAQSEIEKHRKAISHLKHLKEIKRRGEAGHGIRELKSQIRELPIRDTENRIEDIEELQELIQSGEIFSIRDRLQDQGSVSESLDELYDRRREITQTLKQKGRERRDTVRYDQEVEDLIIDALQEFTCPICGRLVREQTARNRLPDKCPQCARPRDLDELRSRLSEKVSAADERIERLDDEIEELEGELDEVDAEINELQSQEADLESLNQFIRTALDQADYDIDQLQERTERELERHREELDQLQEKEEELSSALNVRRALIESFDESLQFASERISELEAETRQEVQEEFTDRISDVFQAIGSDLGTQVGISSDGELQFPGTGSEGVRTFSRLSSGERQLANLAFTITLAQFAQENSDAHEWEVLVLDEPLTDLESDVQDSVLEYLLDSDLQCIITSSLEEVRSHFRNSDAEIQPVNRITTQDTTLDEYL